MTICSSCLGMKSGSIKRPIIKINTSSSADLSVGRVFVNRGLFFVLFGVFFDLQRGCDLGVNFLGKTQAAAVVQS